MPLLTLSQVEKSYGINTILSGISLQLQRNEKAGLIGPNGSGKTTLLKIIAGETEADQGEVHIEKRALIGYLSQETPEIPSGTLLKHLEYPLKNILDMKKEITALEKKISLGAEMFGNKDVSIDQHLKRYAEVVDSFEQAGGYKLESKLKGVARGLGFTENDLGRDISSFSGGEKTRARLAGLLLRDLDLLLLDEPTNFLDLGALEWLEKYLRDLHCALLVVSHDRYFLDRVVNRIFALKEHKIKAYSGNYTSYQEKLELETGAAEKEFQQQQLLKEREERLVREAKADERSKKQARSRQKRLEKMQVLSKPEAGQQSFKLDFNYTGRSGRLVVVFEEIYKQFEDAGVKKEVFKDMSFQVRWGDRIAIVGPNGAGKSTLLKMIAGSVKPDSGLVKLGPSVKVLYFDQEQEQLRMDKNLVETIIEASDMDIKQARNHLGRYLFRGDDVFKKVGDLSGGEKSRLALARLSLSSGNCLLMDEPTSHLDLPAMEELEKLLRSFPGTLIIVSHDRYFLKGLANRVLDLKNGLLKVHDCSFEQYLERLENEESDKTGQCDGRVVDKKRRQDEHRLRQLEQKRIRKMKKDLERIEDEISGREQLIAGIEMKLSDPELYGDHQQLADLGIELHQAREDLNDLLKKWEETISSMEE